MTQATGRRSGDGRAGFRSRMRFGFLFLGRWGEVGARRNGKRFGGATNQAGGRLLGGGTMAAGQQEEEEDGSKRRARVSRSEERRVGKECRN